MDHIRLSIQSLLQQLFRLDGILCMAREYPFCSLAVGGRIKSMIPHAAIFLQDCTDITLWQTLFE